jgi:hypothetical protein
MSEHSDFTQMSVDALRAELAGTREYRDKEATGQMKAAATRKVKALEDELKGRGESVDVPEAASTDGSSTDGDKPATKVDPLVAPDNQARVHDSDVFDGVRFSVTTDGRVWRPDGDTRLGEVVGFVERESKQEEGSDEAKLTGYWLVKRSPSDEEPVGRDRSRRQALKPLVESLTQTAA